jgi:hypothetical protein
MTKVFRPRDKDQDCEHWCDCYKKAEWVIEIGNDEETYYLFFCQEHLDTFKQSEDA